MEAVTARVTEDIKRDIDERFSRSERALENFAAPRPQQPPSSHPNPAPGTTNDSASADMVSLPTSHQPMDVSNQSSQLLATDNIHRTTPVATETPLLQSQNPRRAAMSQPEPASTSAQDVNKNNTPHAWRAWFAAQQGQDQAPSANFRASRYENDALYDQTIDAQVRHIIEATPHSLKGNNPHDFPYNYVSRGPEKRKLSFNSVTLAEHIYGIFCMIDDNRVDPSIKPDLIEHMKEVAEDACEFEWSTHVRRWSEEVFSRVLEKRLPQGCRSTVKIQNLRTGMSRVDSARLPATKDQREHRDQRDHREQREHREQPSGRRYPTSTYQNDQLRGGPPCKDYNSSQGCSLQSGHSIHGKKQVHVCSYCLVNTAAAHPHSKAHSRTKQRHAAAHF